MLLLGTDGSRTRIPLADGEKYPYKKLQELCGSKKTRKQNIDIEIKTYGDMGLVLVENEFSVMLMDDNFNALATTFARDANGGEDNSHIMGILQAGLYTH